MPIAIDRTTVTESKGQSKRNRSNMESDFVLPCYNLLGAVLGIQEVFNEHEL